MTPTPTVDEIVRWLRAKANANVTGPMYGRAADTLKALRRECRTSRAFDDYLLAHRGEDTNKVKELSDAITQARAATDALVKMGGGE